MNVSAEAVTAPEQLCIHQRWTFETRRHPKMSGEHETCLSYPTDKTVTESEPLIPALTRSKELKLKRHADWSSLKARCDLRLFLDIASVRKRRVNGSWRFRRLETNLTPSILMTTSWSASEMVSHHGLVPRRADTSPQALTSLERDDVDATGLVSGSDPTLFLIAGEAISALPEPEGWILSSSDVCLGH